MNNERRIPRRHKPTARGEAIYFILWFGLTAFLFSIPASAIVSLTGNKPV